jgi:hypothetical protein
MFGESVKRRTRKCNEMKAMASHENFRWRWSIVGKRDGDFEQFS